MNRYKITRANVEKAKQFIKGKITLSQAPNYVKKYQSEMAIKNGTVMYQNKALIPIEDRTAFYRKEILRKQSIVPLNKAGFHALQEIGWGLTRISWMNFLKSQRLIRNLDRAPAEHKKQGKKANTLQAFESDLSEVKRSQLPKPLKHLKDSYICVTVHRVSSLMRATWCRNKRPATVTPIVIKQIEELAKVLQLPAKIQKTCRTDQGFEFDSVRLKKSNILHKPGKIANSAEGRIGLLRRHLYKQMLLKKGGFESTLNQTVDMLNQGLRSKVSGKTPYETAKIAKKPLLQKFNAKRQGGKGSQRKHIAVGDRVRLSLRNKKDVIYKSNNQTQWDKTTYIVKGKSKSGMSFKLHVRVRKNNLWQRIWKWVSGDRIQKIPQKDDLVTESVLAERTQSGTIRKKPTRKKTDRKVPTVLRRSARLK